MKSLLLLITRFSWIQRTSDNITSTHFSPLSYKHRGEDFVNCGAQSIASSQWWMASMWTPSNPSYLSSCLWTYINAIMTLLRYMRNSSWKPTTNLLRHREAVRCRHVQEQELLGKFPCHSPRFVVQWFCEVSL